MIKKINIAIPEELLIALDDHCKKYNYERSEFVRALIRTKLFGSTPGQPKTGEKTISKDSQYAEKLNTAKAVLAEFTSPQEQPKTVPTAHKRCNICHNLKESVRPVEYLFEGERTIDEMCTGCIGKIPLEMQIKEYELPIASIPSAWVYPGTPDEKKPVKAYPKPVKKAKK